MRSRSLLAVLAAALLAASAPAALAASPVADACRQASPSAAPCIGAGKLEELAPADRSGEVEAYRSSWQHRAAAFQYRIGAPVPLREAQWLGTHNSFNADVNGFTLSHTDSNQQLSLVQQLDVDVRSLELDVHYLPSVHAGGQDAVVVCHGRGPDQEHFGCTSEPLLTDVLPALRDWLTAHPGDVLMLYLEDELGAAAGYDETVSALESALRRTDGSSMILHPQDPPAGGCANLPLALSRQDALDAGAQVVLVGNCRSGWAADVFGWDAVHVESGSTPQYRAFPACDATYDRGVYADKLVRYFEDSTFVSAAVDPTESPAAAADNRLSPDRVAAMVACGVNLFGFDQLLPGDGRIAASIWSWAEGQPAAGGGCAIQRADGRWETAACGARRPAACLTGAGTWTTSTPVAGALAEHACRAAGARFAIPRTGEQNALLHAVAGGQAVWLDVPGRSRGHGRRDR